MSVLVVILEPFSSKCKSTHIGPVLFLVLCPMLGPVLFPVLFLVPRPMLGSVLFLVLFLVHPDLLLEN